jgi:hypothetical protein
MVHEKPQQRKTWDDNGVEGWYLGPAMTHYRCYRCYINATKGERNSDTVEFFPTQVSMPALSSQDKAIAAIQDLITLLRNPKPASPFLTYGPKAPAAIETLADIFQPSQENVQPNNAPTNAIEPHKTQPPPRVPVRKATMPLPRVPFATDPLPPPRVPDKGPIAVPKVPATHRYATRTATRQANNQPAYKARALNYILDSERAYNTVLNAVTDPLTGIQMEYKDLMKDPALKPIWIKSMANEFGRLAQGVGTRMPTGSGTIHFITPDQIPKGKFATYARIVCDIRPQKAEKHRVRLTVGGNLINYPHKVSTPTADISTVKCLFNSVVSTLNAIFTGADIKDFYLNTPLEEYEYMRIHADLVPDEIIQQYNLQDKIVNGYVYMEIRKGMYGLPQAGIIAHNQLKEHLSKYGYAPCRYTPGLWGHSTRKTKFCLVVDDFGIKTTSKDDLEHLLNALKDKYTISIDSAGELYCGIHLKWDYVKRTVRLSMPEYVRKALERFMHRRPNAKTDAPHEWTEPVYGQKRQMAEEPDSTPLLSPADKTFVQQVVGVFLYYGRAVDLTILTALNSIAETQAAPTARTMQQCNQLLDYLSWHPNAEIEFVASDMQLWVHGDAAYLVAAKARSRIAGYFFLSDVPKKPLQPHPNHNAAIHVECRLLKHVVASAAESETGALFHNGQLAIPLVVTLEELEHVQQCTPLITDNSTSAGFVNDTIKQRKSKSWDMRFHWLKDKVQDNTFQVNWESGKHNKADYMTKHWSPIYHRRIRPVYMANSIQEAFNHCHALIQLYQKTTSTQLSPLRGCAERHALDPVPFGTEPPKIQDPSSRYFHQCRKQRSEVGKENLLLSLSIYS